MKNRLMFNPGPTNVHEDVRQALLAPDRNHREAAFAQLLGSVRATITHLMDLNETHTCIPLSVSGTGANEAVLATVRGTVGVLVAGRFSVRLADIAEWLGLPVVRISFDPLVGIDINALDQFLEKRPDITHVCFVHHETTTGVLAPLDEIASIAGKHKVSLIVDGISSIFGNHLGFRHSQVDYYTVTANKCLESVPGLSFVIARRSLVERPQTRSHSYYLDLSRAYRHMENLGQPPFTHGYALYNAAQVALDRLREETVHGRIARYQRLRKRMKAGLTKLGLIPVNLPEEFQASYLQLFHLPVDLDFQRLHDRMLQWGVTTYTDTETLARGYMYFATMGAMDDADVDYFLHAVESELPAAWKTPASEDTVTGGPHNE